MFPIVIEYNDDELIKHLEEQHPEDLAMVFTEGHRRFASRRTWDVYHDYWLHRAKPDSPDHAHAGYLWKGWERGTVRVLPGWKQMSRCTCLQPPTHQADCPGKQGVVTLGEDNGGPNAREKMWAALDQRTDGLKALAFEDMVSARVEASTLSWCLAILDSPSDPDQNAIRKEAMRRWKERQDVVS